MLFGYGINWFICPPHVAHARQMTLSKGGLIAKEFPMRIVCAPYKFCQGGIATLCKGGLINQGDS